METNPDLPESNAIETEPSASSRFWEEVDALLMFVYFSVPATMAASYVYFLITFGANHYGVLGVIVTVALGVPTSLMVAGAAAILLMPVAIVLDAIVQWSRSVTRRPGP